jgi:hypothetical protein
LGKQKILFFTLALASLNSSWALHPPVLQVVTTYHGQTFHGSGTIVQKNSVPYLLTELHIVGDSMMLAGQEKPIQSHAHHRIGNGRAVLIPLTAAEVIAEPIPYETTCRNYPHEKLKLFGFPNGREASTESENYSSTYFKGSPVELEQTSLRREWFGASGGLAYIEREKGKFLIVGTIRGGEYLMGEKKNKFTGGIYVSRVSDCD